MLGIDVSDRSIKVVETTDDIVPKLRSVCWSSIPPDIMRRGSIQDAAAMTEALRQARTKCTPVPVSDSKAVISLPESQSFVRTLELPRMSQGETEEAVQWAIRQHIPFDLERVYLDWQPVLYKGLDANKQQVLVGAAQKEVIDPLLNIADNVGLEVVAFELEAQAIVRSLLPLDAGDVEGVLLVDLGATATDVIFFDRGSIRYTSSIQRGGDDLTQFLVQRLSLDPSIAAEKKALVGVKADSVEREVALALREGAMELVRQIDKMVQAVAVQMQVVSGVKAILLAGGAANMPGLVDLFAEVFAGVPVQIGNPLINLSLDSDSQSSPLSQADASHFTTAIGLSLRRDNNE